MLLGRGSMLLCLGFVLLSHVSTARAEAADSLASELPYITLSFDSAAFNETTFIPADFTLTDGDSIRQLQCVVRRRGATSLRYDKPNYALKFVHADGTSDDVRLLGMRKDNYWILDGMASDYSKMRNRVSMDLWLDYSRPPYHQEAEPNAVNGYRGRFVEVYVNGGYMGVFCLMERVDRKQLKLKKFREEEVVTDDSVTFETHPAYHRGLLYKAVNGNNTRTPYLLWQQNEPDNQRHSYDGMQGEYPDVTAGEPWTWNPLRDNIYFLAARTSTTFRNKIGGYFDVPVFIDYVLLLDLLYANDNVGKNVMYWFYDQSSADQRVGITPWDLDTSWGRDYLGRGVSVTKALSNKSNFNTRFQSWYPGYADTLAVRYAQLRDSLWSEQALCARFDHYFDLLCATGAWQREAERWVGSNCMMRADAENERQFITTWIHGRLEYLDGVYGYNPPVPEPNPDLALPAISTTRPQPDDVCYDLFGRRVSSDHSLILNQKQGLIIRR